MKVCSLRPSTLVLFLLLLTGGGLFSQEKEDKADRKQIFDLDLKDVDTDIFWQGYWRYKLQWGNGLEKGLKGFVFPKPYPGLAHGFQFIQEPDFFLSILFFNHYFLEFSFTDKSEQNTYAMGYIGDESTTVKELRIGNAGIGMKEYWGIESSSPRFNTPGFKGTFKTPHSEHEAMIRYDPTEQESKIFMGEYEITEESIGLPHYRTGQDFILPDTGISNVQIYLEDTQGEIQGSDGRRYTSRNIDCHTDLSLGFIGLEKAPEGRVLVFYRCKGKEVGDQALGPGFIIPPDQAGRPDPSQPLLDFAWNRNNPYAPKKDGTFRTFEESTAVTIEGYKALLVHNPGEFSPFQMYNTYDFYQNLPRERWRTTIGLDNESPEDESFLFLTHVSDLSRPYLEVKVKGTEDRSPRNRLPFARVHPGIYGPGREKDQEKTARKIRIGVKQNNSGYFLGNNLVKGSVQVFVNGEEDLSVKVDYSRGSLQFSRYIFPEDRIKVLYRTENAGLGGGDLLMAQGNRLHLGKNWRLELGESLRWSLPENKITTRAGEHPGHIDLAGALFYDRDNLKAMAGAILNISTPDTSGNLRLFGMEEGGAGFSISQEQLLPGERTLTPPPQPPVPNLNPGSRKDLLYRNFVYTNTFGQSTLHTYQWKDALVKADKEGPSLARAREEDPFESRVMVMDCRLQDGEWSAGDYVPEKHGLVDLSEYEALTFWLRQDNLNTDYLKVYLILGENGESRELYKGDIKEKGNPAFVIEKDISSHLPTSSGQWRKITLPLTSGERKRLSRFRSFRFILQSRGGSTEGRLLAAGFRMEGPPFHITVKDASGAIKNRDDVIAREGADSGLSRQFSRDMGIFHPRGGSQKALKMEWGSACGGSPLSRGDRIQASGWFNPLSSGDYGEFSLYIKNTDTEGEGRFDITNSKGRGIHLQYKPGSTRWEKLTINLRNGKAWFTGASPGSRVTSLLVDKDTDTFSRFHMERKLAENNLSGALFLDEIHFSRPNYTTASLFESSVDYKKPGVIQRFPQGFPLLANIETSGTLKYGRKESPTLFAEEGQRLESRLSAAGDLLGLRLEGDFEMVKTEGLQNLRGGHYIKVPAAFPGIWLSDRYSRSFHAKRKDVMARENILHTAPLPGLSLEISSTAQGSKQNLLQSWKGLVNLTPRGPVTGWTDVRLFQKTGWQSASDSYFQDWARDFQYLLPQKGLIKSREGLFSTGAQGRWGGFNSRWQAHLEYTAGQQLVWEQENRWISDLSFPMELPGSALTWTLNPGYKRSLSQKHQPRKHQGFSEDTKTLFTGMASQFPLTHFIPLYDVFDPRGLDGFTQTLNWTGDASYTPEIYCRLDRPSGSRLKDLFLPAGLNSSASRSYYKKKNSLYTREEWNLSLHQRAINLFGSQGSHPFLDFYTSDEIASSFQITMKGRNRNIPEPQSLVYQNYLFLAEGERWQCILDNSFTRNWKKDYNKDDFQLIFRWSGEEMSSIPIPFRKKHIPGTARMHHEEKLTFSGYFEPDKKENNAFDGVLRHESKMVIQNFGSLKGWMAMGMGKKQKLFRGGLELGMELKITF